MMKNEKKSLAELILKHMAVHQLDQKSMAEKLGIQPATLCAWLNPSGHGITRKNAERIKFVCRDVIAISGNGNQVQTASADDSDKSFSAVEKFRAGLICALIDSELSPEALQIALKVVKDFKG